MKRVLGKKHILVSMLLTLALISCGGSDDETPVNSAPSASSVSITDDNADNAVVGDGLSGSYSYVDVDSDAEGTTTFRWLRGGSPISGATALTYTLVSADVATQVTFEVTPVAATGTTTGSAVTSTALKTGTAPVVSGVVRYLDINKNGVNDTNDQLIVPFDQVVSINTAISSDFDLPVASDVFGTGATVTSGPASNEVSITLGSSPNFKTRQDFSASATAANSASGIDISALINAEAIEGASGIDAVASAAIDIIPAYVDSLQSIGNGSRITASIALGDVDGDGDLDMIEANTGSQPNLVYLNDGANNFSVSGQSLGANILDVCGSG